MVSLERLRDVGGIPGLAAGRFQDCTRHQVSGRDGKSARTPSSGPGATGQGRRAARLATLAGTPASPPKPSKAGPGRPKGRRSTPAPRYVIKKAA